MNEDNFKKKIIETVALLLRFRQEESQSDRRILRDTIRAIVKELTRV